MDPVSAFSLACGVVQMIDFSCKLLSKTKELYTKGHVYEHQEIEEQVSQLCQLRSLLESKMNSGSLNNHSQENESSEIENIADKCDGAALELLQELENLKISEPRSTRKAVKKSFAAMRKTGTIDKLKHRLDDLQKTLDTRVLMDIKRKIDRIPVQQIERSEKLDESLQAITVAFKTSNASFKDVVNITRRERDLTKKDLDERFQRQEEFRLQENFLDSLRFPDILCREEQIKSAHKQTFQWIFDESGQSVRPWSNFVEWLLKGSGTYWINGKAGSGKSTLMSYIWQDSRTANFLGKWAGTKELLTPAFFFWASGNALQRSTEGFLRSILCQVLSSHRELISLLRQDNRLGSSNNSLYAWTEKRLLEGIDIVFAEISKRSRVCLFIDGLDEFQGDYHRLIDLVRQIVDNPGVKCCFSSRPEKAIQEGFRRSNQLRLQDLTRGDIETFVDGELGKFLQVRRLPARLEWERKCLRNIIVEKADGVFLWVELVVKSQVIGIKNDDSLEILKERLSSLPTEVEGLYSRMLSRIDKFYCREAAWYIDLALICHHHTGYERPEAVRGVDYFLSNICAFTIAKLGLTDRLRLTNYLTQDDFAQKCSYTCDRLLLTCAGLLEVDFGTCWVNEAERIEFLGSWQRWKPEGFNLVHAGINWAYAHVRFCHRTALDFFYRGQEGFAFLQEHKSFPDYRWLLPSAISLGRMTLFNSDDPQMHVFDHVGCMMTFASNWDPQTRDVLQSSLELMDYFHDVIGKFCQTHHVIQDADKWPNWWFEELRAMCRPNRSKPSVLGAPQLQTGNGFIDLATIFNVFWYTRHALQGTTSGPSRATHLALLTAMGLYRDRTWTHNFVPPRSDVMRRHKRRYWGIDWNLMFWNQVEMLLELILSGADPNAGQNGTIWRQTLDFLYKQKYINWPLIDRHRTDKDYRCVIDPFLDAGADSQAVVTTEWGCDRRSAFKVRFDTSMVPLIPSKEHEGTSVAAEDDSCIDSTMTQQSRNPRVQMYLMHCNFDHFRDCDDSSGCALWSTDGVTLSDLQTSIFCAKLRRILDATKDEKTDLRADIGRWLCNQVTDDCEQCQERTYHDCPDYPLDPLSDDEDSDCMRPLLSLSKLPLVFKKLDPSQISAMAS